jgi:peptidoglycan/LPS O-acetylase OafA/YrhL
VRSGASFTAIFTVTFARMDAIAIGAAIAVIARSPGGLSRLKPWALPIAALALAGLVTVDLLSGTAYLRSIELKLAIQCTLFVWLWGAFVFSTLTAVSGSLVQRVTYAVGLRILGKYSYALYLFHMHMNRVFTKLGFDPLSGVTIKGSVLPWQILYIVVASAASLVLAYLSWHLYEKHFLKLKAYFSVRKRAVAAQPALPLIPALAPIPVAATTNPQPKRCSADGRNDQ